MLQNMYVVQTLDPQFQQHIVNAVLTLQSQVQYHNVNTQLEKCIREVHWQFFFNRRYNSQWILACFTILFHNLLSLHFSLQFLIFVYYKSSSICSSHLSLGLPTGLDEHDSHSFSFLTILVVSFLITCAAHRNLCDFINLTIVSFLIRIHGLFNDVLNSLESKSTTPTEQSTWDAASLYPNTTYILRLLDPGSSW